MPTSYISRMARKSWTDDPQKRDNWFTVSTVLGEEITAWLERNPTMEVGGGIPAIHEAVRGRVGDGAYEMWRNTSYLEKKRIGRQRAMGRTQIRHR